MATAWFPLYTLLHSQMISAPQWAKGSLFGFRCCIEFEDFEQKTSLVTSTTTSPPYYNVLHAQIISCHNGLKGAFSVLDVRWKLKNFLGNYGCIHFFMREILETSAQLKKKRFVTAGFEHFVHLECHHHVDH